MGAAHSSDGPETAEAFDLGIDVSLSDDAIPPEYATPGRCSFTIFAPKDLELLPDEWTAVPTGLSFRLPFMLVISVGAHDPDIAVNRMLIDCDSEAEIVLHVMYRASPVAQTSAKRKVARGDPLASGLVLPIARPAFRLFKTEVERV